MMTGQSPENNVSFISGSSQCLAARKHFGAFSGKIIPQYKNTNLYSMKIAVNQKDNT